MTKDQDVESDDMDRLAKRFFDALEATDIDALKALYAKDAVLWTNVAQREVAAHDVIPFLPIMARKMPDRRYADRSVTAFPGGFVHRHRLTGTRRDGARVSARCCAIVFVNEGQVVRVEEYVDSRQLDAVMG